MTGASLCTWVDRKGRRCLRSWHADSRHQYRPLPRQSVKGARKARRWAKTSRDVRAARPWCEARFAEDCTGRATEVHHPLRQSQGGDTGPIGKVPCCAICHFAIHAYPDKARAAGLLFHSWEAAS